VAAGQDDSILVAEIEQQIHTIARSLRDDDLPFEATTIVWPSEDAISDDDRMFVRQLRLIAMASPRLGQCIYDHNRAFQQRSYWQRENLLNVGELSRYDETLRDEWRRHFTPVDDDEASLLAPESEIRKAARQKFKALDEKPLPRIRDRVQETYIACGSLHILADRGLIGWHPNWVSHLRQQVDTAVEGNGAA